MRTFHAKANPQQALAIITELKAAGVHIGPNYELAVENGTGEYPVIVFNHPLLADQHEGSVCGMRRPSIFSGIEVPVEEFAKEVLAELATNKAEEKEDTPYEYKLFPEVSAAIENAQVENWKDVNDLVYAIIKGMESKDSAITPEDSAAAGYVMYLMRPATVNGKSYSRHEGLVNANEGVIRALIGKMQSEIGVNQEDDLLSRLMAAIG